MGIKSFQKPDFNFNFRDSKENFSNFNNEIMSNKGSFFPPNSSNYNDTEIEIMNENGKEFSSFIETPRASGVYNKRLNFNMNNTYNLKNMNLKMKKIKDKINQNAKEIQRVISYDEGSEFAIKNGIIFGETSAKSGDGIDDIFLKSAKEIIKNMNENYYDLASEICGIKRGNVKKNSIKGDKGGNKIDLQNGNKNF